MGGLRTVHVALNHFWQLPTLPILTIVHTQREAFCVPAAGLVSEENVRVDPTLLNNPFWQWDCLSAVEAE